MFTYFSQNYNSADSSSVDGYLLLLLSSFVEFSLFSTSKAFLIYSRVSFASSSLGCVDLYSYCCLNIVRVHFSAISDTCLAMGEWVENPHAETALSNILPCVDQRTTNQTMYKSRQVINDIANMVNGFVGSVANSNPPPQAGTSYFNQSGPLIPPLCYPYDAQLQDRTCSSGELSMENATSVSSLLRLHLL